jgi:hypothetical protein
MDDQIGNVEESSGMSISSNEHGTEQPKEGNVELQQDHPTDSVLEDPELGMTFDNADDVREYYNKYAKAISVSLYKCEVQRIPRGANTHDVQ